MEIDGELKMYANAIMEGTLLGTCDGSVKTINKKDKGAHAFALSTTTSSTIELKGSKITLDSTAISSLTTEVNSIIATTAIILCITLQHPLDYSTSHIITIYCDNDQAVNMVNNMEPPVNMSETLVP